MTDTTRKIVEQLEKTNPQAATILFNADTAITHLKNELAASETRNAELLAVVSKLEEKITVLENAIDVHTEWSE